MVKMVNITMKGDIRVYIIEENIAHNGPKNDYESEKKRIT